MPTLNQWDYKHSNSGESKQLSVTSFEPYYATDQTVTWSSSNTSVATIDNSGKVQAVSVGKAEITCRSNDGSVSATCAVTVNNVPATGITVLGLTNNNHNLNLKKSKTEFGSVTLKAALLPENTTDVLSDGVTFEMTGEEQKISGKTVAAVIDNNDGTVTVNAKAPGKVTIKVSYGSFENSFTVTVLQTYTLINNAPDGTGTYLIAHSSTASSKTPVLSVGNNGAVSKNTSYTEVTSNGWTYLVGDFDSCECVADATTKTIKYGNKFYLYLNIGSRPSELTTSQSSETLNSITNNQVVLAKTGSGRSQTTYYLCYRNSSFTYYTSSQQSIRWFIKDAPKD